MKVALVVPAPPAEMGGIAEHVAARVGAGWARDRFHDQPPLAPLLLSALLGDSAECRLCREAFDGPFRPAHGDDLVLLSFTTAQADRAREIAAACRASGVRTVAGGVHATAAADECAAHFSAVCAGEMESLPAGWFAAVARGDAAGVFRTAEADPADVPVPDYGLLSPARDRVVPVQATRGCPVGCEFCAATAVFGKRHRAVPAPTLAASLERIGRIFPDRAAVRLLLVDDNFFLDRDHAFAVLDLIGRSGFAFSAYADIRIAFDAELLRAASRAGLRSVFVGLESARPARIEGASPMKAALASRYGELVDAIQAEGIGVFASFVLGFDADSADTFAELREFLRAHPLHRAAFGFPVPYPGTPLAARLSREGRLPAAPWSAHHEWNPLIGHPTLSRAELLAGVRGLYDLFYSEELSSARVRHFKRILGGRT